MTQIKYHLFWPSGNTTALVETTVAKEQYPLVAKAILNKHTNLEQVGFIEPPRFSGSSVRLQMAGNEFCGNAARSLANWWSRLHKRKMVNLEVSGFDHVLKARLNGDNAELLLPPEFIIKAEKIPGGFMVILQGITHIVTDKALSEPGTKELLESHKSGHDAVGIMSYQSGADGLHLDPLVWVRGGNTCYNETACGSGTIALSYAIKRFLNQGVSDFAIKQPSGEILSVRFVGDKKKPNAIVLSGKVSYLGSDSLEFG